MATSALASERPPGRTTEHLRAGASDAMRQDWAVHRTERREAIALGHVRGFLSEHPDRASEFLRTIAEALS